MNQSPQVKRFDQKSDCQPVLVEGGIKERTLT
jgi:hypothetical protein